MTVCKTLGMRVLGGSTVDVNVSFAGDQIIASMNQYTAADIASLKAKLAQYPSGTELQLNISGSPQQVALMHGAIEAVPSEHRFEIGQPEPTNQKTENRSTLVA
jgi:hypothetical protein